MRGSRVFYGLSAIIVFIFSLQLLSQSTQALKPFFESLLRQFITNQAQAMGGGWISSYIMLNGSTVAAVGVTLLDSALLTETQTFLLVSGSRLGAAFIVVVIGFLEYFQGKNSDLTDSCSIGILSFLITYSTYIPGAFLGYYLLENFQLSFLEILPPEAFQYSITAFFEPSVRFVSSNISPEGSFTAALFLLFISLNRFDKAFAGVGKSKIRNNYIRFLLSHKWYSFIGGAILTLLTTSVSLSLGIIVPLYNQNYIKRKEIIPYIMGANITTLIDTILAAAILESKSGMKVVLLVTFTAAIFTLIALKFFSNYFRALKYIFDKIATERGFMAAFIGSLILVPLGLLLI